MSTSKPQSLNEDARMRLLSKLAEASVSAQRSLVDANVLETRGDLQGAVKHFARFEEDQRLVLQITETLNQVAEIPEDPKLSVNTLTKGLFMYADALEALRKRNEAAEKRALAVQISGQYLGIEGAADAERSRAASLTMESRFNEALVALHTARDLFDRAGIAIKVARTTMDIADLLQWLGDYERALQEVDHALKFSREAPLRNGLRAIEDSVEKWRIEAEGLYFRGMIAKFLGRFAEAEESFRKVLPEYQKLKVGEAIECQIAIVLTRSGKPEEGLALASRIEPTIRTHERFRPKLAGLLNVQAEALVRLGRPNEALVKLEEGLRDLEQYFDLDLRWRLEWNYASALRQAQHTEEALTAYRHALDTVVRLRRAPLGYRLDSTYLRDKLDLFTEAIDLAVSLKRPRDAALGMDDIKSRTLRVTLSIPRATTRSASADRPSEFAQLTQRLDALEFRGLSGGWTLEQRRERDALLSKRNELLEQLRFSDPRWRNMTEPLTLDFERLITRLKQQNQAVLSLFLRAGRVFCVLLSGVRESATVTTLSEQLQSKLNKYAENLTRQNPNLLLFDSSPRLGITAEALVPEEILAAAVSAESLLVVPHGLLHLLPWPALTLGGKRLFEHCAVGVLPNLSCVLGLSFMPEASPRITIVGPPDNARLKDLPPLTYAEAETKELEEIYAGRVVREPLRGKAVSESGFWESALDPAGAGQILHVSCHGSLVADEPMNCGLLLADGKADAAEIAQLKLPYHEVVLSACSTGWRPTQVGGVELVGDDILGIPGAFLEAGARSVLVSIPPVPLKAATAFVLHYHRNRSDGKPPLAAYCTAQRKMLNDGRFLPAEWVGFTLYGCS